MKKFLALIAAFFALGALCLAGCGEYKPPASPGTTVPGSPDDPDKPIDTENTFSVSLLYQNELFAPQETIYALWREIDGVAVYSAPFDASGVARIEGLDGDYTVTLSALPAGYTYNPNIYMATNDEKRVAITLYQLTPTRGSGSDKYDNIIRLASPGAYRVTIARPDQTVYLQFEPSKRGQYSMQSIIDVSANEINPILDIYQGTTAWKPEKPTETVDGGGEENTYTKNFRWEIQYPGTSGTIFAFGLRAQGINDDAFPVAIDFILDADGEFTGGGSTIQYETVYAKEEFKKTPEYSATFQYVAGLRPNRVLDASLFKLNPEDGYYHFYDEATDTYGGILYAKINKDPQIVSTQTGMWFLDGQVSKKCNGKDYSQFVSAYAQYVNGDGVYAVTEELKTFLQDFSVAQRYFNDGNGWAELNGYNSSEANQWLFDCGYYEIGINIV